MGFNWKQTPFKGDPHRKLGFGSPSEILFGKMIDFGEETETAATIFLNSDSEFSCAVFGLQILCPKDSTERVEDPIFS